MMVPLLALLAYSSSCALVCFAVYGALRWLSRVAPIVFYIFGILGVMAQLFALWLVGVVSLTDWDSPGYEFSSSADWSFLGGVLAIWGVTVGMAITVVRRADQGQLTNWRAFLFYPLYWIASFIFIGLVSQLSGWVGAVGNYWVALWSPIGNGFVTSAWFYGMNALLLWMFPLGAPTLELLVSNFRRISRTVATGSRG